MKQWLFDKWDQPHRRVVCWFSCGATSAIATKIALAEYGKENTVIAYCDTGAEHESNYDFLKACEKWYDQAVTRIGGE